MNEKELASLGADNGTGVSLSEWFGVSVLDVPLLRKVRARARKYFSLVPLPVSKGAVVPVMILVAGTLLFGNAGYRDTIAASASVSAGMVATELVLNGNDHLNVADIEVELAGLLGSAMLTLDPRLAATELKKNRWIKTAQVRKVYPDTLVVDISERKPVALWKSENRLYLISSDGVAIDQAQAKHALLPQVVGGGANRVAAEFLSTMALYPELAGRARAYVRVAERRWNVVLDGGLTVLLPDEDWKQALGQLKQLQLEKKILDREIVQLDMRMPDRLVMKLTPAYATKRAEIVEKIISGKESNI